MNAFMTSDSETQTCESCGQGEAKLGVERIEFAYGAGDDAVTLFADMPVWSCAACGERYIGEGAEEAERNAICAHLGRLTPAQIRQAREKAGLTQTQLAAELGVGRVSLARWETGQQLQSQVYDGLIRAWEANRLKARPVRPQPRFRTDVGHRRAAADAFRLQAAG